MISYAGSPFTFINNSRIFEIIPQNSGGESDNWSQIDETLPLGLTLNATTGVISGTPLLAPTYANITIVASNAGGSDFFPIQFIVNKSANTAAVDEGAEDNIIIRYITNEPIIIIGGISIFVLICLLIAGIIVGFGVGWSVNEKDLTEAEKSKLADQYNKLYRDSHTVVPDWDKIGKPQHVLSELDTKINALNSATIPESEHLKKAKRNFVVMKTELKTPAAATPYLRSILTSILRAYREHLRTALANSELNGKILAEKRGSVILQNIEAGLQTTRNKNVYKKLLNAGYIEKGTEELFPALSKLMDRLNKAIHLEDTDSSILEEEDFIHAVVLMQKFLMSGFR